MALLDNDVILVYDVSASTLKKCAIGNLATNVASNDLFLVDRPQGAASFTRGKMTYSNWKSSAQSGDLLLVETAGRKSGNEVKKKTTKSSFDTKVAGVDIYNAVVPIDVIPVYTSEIPSASSSDSTENWNVLQVVMNVTDGVSATSHTGRLYIGVKITTNSSYPYYNDFCIAAVQIIDPSTQSPRYDSNYPDSEGGYTWNFHRTDKFGVGAASTGGGDGTANQWLTSAGAQNDSLSGGGSFLGSTTNSIDTTTASTFEWQRASNTSSAHVGAADGINTGYPGILPVGRRNIAQVSNTFYIYCETSAAGGVGTPAPGDFMWIMSPELTIHNGDLLRICYHEQAGNNDSGQGFTASNTLHVHFQQ